MSFLQPRDDRFFQIFNAAADNVRQGAEALLAMLKHYEDVSSQARTIKAIEHKGDDLTHDAYEQLNRIFVTPLDREDIAAIASALDDILDLIEASANDFVLCGIEQPTDAAITLGEILVRCTVHVQEAVAMLKSRKDRQGIRDPIREINTLENEGDQVYRGAIQTLFQQQDPIYLIKWKQVYDHLERAIDNCEDVADLLHGVYLKHA